ncbi:MAG: hypothetical protein Q9191_002596 [Dirinaria sp. TL-2023a]
MAIITVDKTQPDEANNDSAASSTSPLGKDERRNNTEGSPACKSEQQAIVPSPEQVVDLCSEEASPATTPPAQKQISKDPPSGARAHFTEEQKAFVLYKSRQCKYAEVASAFRVLFPGRPMDEAKAKSLRTRLRHDKKELYLLNAATTYHWYKLVVPDDHHEPEQPMVLGDCTEEQKSFLFYHYARKRLQPLRVVELFNEHFSRAVTFARLSNLFIVLELEGNDSSQSNAWMEIAQRSEWHEKYLPEPDTGPKKDQNPCLSRHGAADPKVALPSKSAAYKSKSVSAQKWSMEHRVYLAWLGLRSTGIQSVVNSFLARFPSQHLDVNVQKVLQRLRRHPEDIRYLASQAHQYPWYERDLVPGEPGFKAQHRIGKIVEVRQKLIDRRQRPSSPTVSQAAPATTPHAGPTAPSSDEAAPVTAPDNIASTSSTSKASEARPADGQRTRPATAQRGRNWSDMLGPNGDSKLMPPPTSRPRHAETQGQVRRHSTHIVGTGPNLQESSNSGPKLTTDDGQRPSKVAAPDQGNRRHSSYIPDSPLKPGGMYKSSLGSRNEQRRPGSASSSMSGVEYYDPAPVQTTGHTRGSQSRGDSFTANQERSRILQARNEVWRSNSSIEKYYTSTREVQSKRVEDDGDCQIIEVRTIQRTRTSSSYGLSAPSSHGLSQHDRNMATSPSISSTQLRSDRAQASDTSVLRDPRAARSQSRTAKPPTVEGSSAPQAQTNPNLQHSAEYHRQQQQQQQRAHRANHQQYYAQPRGWYRRNSKRDASAEDGTWKPTKGS